MKQLALLSLCLLLFCLPAQAAPEKGASIVPNQPAAVDVRVTAVSVRSEGTDSIGARLGTALKESFNASNLFRLSEQDEGKLLLLVRTAPEFPSRPSVGSVFSVTWAYSQADNTLPMILGQDLGTVSDESLRDLVARLVERTDGISVKYKYLWKK